HDDQRRSRQEDSQPLHSRLRRRPEPIILFARAAQNVAYKPDMPPQELTRRAMYDLIWSRPMRKAAEELGISDVALKKICDKHRVPTPPRGYWAKKQAGKPVREVRLHETADPQDEHIVIHGPRNLLAPEIRQVLDQERERRKARPKPQPMTEA